MQFQGTDHIGIAVKDLNAAKKTYELLLGTAPFKEEYVVSQDVHVVFFKAGSTKIELLQGAPGSIIQRYTERKGEGIHHVAYLVEDIREAINIYREKGFNLIDDEPREGANNKWVAFLHPKSCNGVLTELCQNRE